MLAACVDLAVDEQYAKLDEILEKTELEIDPETLLGDKRFHHINFQPRGKNQRQQYGDFLDAE